MKTTDEIKVIIDNTDFLCINEKSITFLQAELLNFDDENLKELLYYIIDNKYDEVENSPILKTIFKDNRIYTMLDSMRDELIKEQEESEKNEPKYDEILCCALGYKKSELTTESISNIIENNFGDKSDIIIKAMKLSFRCGHYAESKVILCTVLGYIKSDSAKLSDDTISNILENKFGDKLDIILTAMKL